MGTVLATLAAGPLIDRITAVRVLPGYRKSDRHHEHIIQVQVGTAKRFECLLLAISGHPERCARESALPPKDGISRRLRPMISG